MMNFWSVLLLCAVTSAFVPSVRRVRVSAATTQRFTHSGGPDSFDMDELKRRIAADYNPLSDLFPTTVQTTPSTKQQAPPSQLETVHIIAFEQGIHSIEYPKGSGNNVVLAFESREACNKFAGTLKAQQFFDPTVQEMFLDSLDSVCEQLGVYFQVVPQGVELIPPQQNVQQLGQHNRSLREQQNHLDYVFFMDGAEFDDEGLTVESYAAFE